jgi:hypothetical protein
VLVGGTYNIMMNASDLNGTASIGFNVNNSVGPSFSVGGSGGSVSGNAIVSLTANSTIALRFNAGTATTLTAVQSGDTVASLSVVKLER